MLAITGASGFIGGYVANVLSHQQKRLTRQAHLVSSPSCTWVEGDLHNLKDIQNFVDHTPILIHLACDSHPRSTIQMSLDIQANLIPSVNLFEAFARNNPDGHIIFSSTGGNMYDDTPDGVFRTEEHTPRPRSCYAIHKLATENCLRLCCEKYGIKGTILRISNPYGVLLPKQRAQGLIGVTFSKLLANEPLNVFDSLMTVRDYIHLSDVAKAFELVIQQPPSCGECRIFHISSGVGYTIDQVLNIIEEEVQKPIVKQLSTHPPSPSWSVLSCQKIGEAIGWTPQVNLLEGIRQMVKV